MSESEALVENAGDEQQVAKGAREAKRRRAAERDDLRAVLSTVEGRRVLWRLLAHCNVFESVYRENAGAMGHASGRQDVGHFVMHEIQKAEPSAFLTMMQEHR